MGKGAQTRERILEQAYRLAAEEGLEGLSIGALAAEVGVSKSGLWAHFGSKDELNVEILRVAKEAFEEAVVKPALKAPRGEPRLRKLFDLWLRWISEPGGCVFLTASIELDDKPDSRARDFLVGMQSQLDQLIAGLARKAIQEGHFLADLDCELFAFEVHSLAYGYSFTKRLLRESAADKRARAAFERLLASSRKTN